MYILYHTLCFRAFSPTHQDCSKSNSFQFSEFFFLIFISCRGFVDVEIAVDMVSTVALIFLAKWEFLMSEMAVFSERNRTSANAAPGRRSGTAPVSLNFTDSTCHQYSSQW